MGREEERPVPETRRPILVVDDELNIRKTLTICLEAEGHKVTAVSNFQDALTEARTGRSSWPSWTCGWARTTAST